MSGHGPRAACFGVGLLGLLTWPLGASAQTTARCELTWTLEERLRAMMDELIEVYSVDSFAALTGRSATRPRGVVERAVRTAFPMPETLPPVREIRSGDDDTVWLLREDLGGAADTWEVFDLEGRLVGRLTTPRVRSIFHRDGWRPLRLTRNEVWGTEQGEYDEPYVVKYAVRRGCA